MMPDGRVFTGKLKGFKEKPRATGYYVAAATSSSSFFSSGV